MRVRLEINDSITLEVSPADVSIVTNIVGKRVVRTVTIVSEREVTRGNPTMEGESK